MRWNHARKGLIVGRVVRDEPGDDFIDIELENEVNMTPTSREVDEWAQPHDVIRARRSLLTELPDDA